MPAKRRFGMDHEYYDWSPLVKRGVLRWPNNARVALGIIVSLEHIEWRPPEDSYHPTRVSGGLSPLRLSHREYGHRVGIFRTLDVLESHGIKATVAMDALTAENYPYLVSHCLDRGCEIIAHGISGGRMITSLMSEHKERECIQMSLEAIKRTTNTSPLGWLGPEYSESSRTPQLLAEAGIRFVCDWTNDEQPYPVKTSQGELFALPVMSELDDVNALWERRIAIDRYADLLKESFDTLYRDGVQNGRLLLLNLHPWLIGQPFRIRYLNDALDHMMRRQGVWPATASEIVKWYRSNPPLPLGFGNRRESSIC